MVIQKLHEAGLRSDHAYTAAVVSIGLSFLSWTASVKGEAAGTDRADRWGIFVGEWAPTFFGLGLARPQYEPHCRGGVWFLWGRPGGRPHLCVWTAVVALGGVCQWEGRMVGCCRVIIQWLKAT